MAVSPVLVSAGLGLPMPGTCSSSMALEERPAEVRGHGDTHFRHMYICSLTSIPMQAHWGSWYEHMVKKR